MRLTIKCSCGKEATFLSQEEVPAEPPRFRTKAEKNGSKGWKCPEVGCPKTIWTREGASGHLYRAHGRLPTDEEKATFLRDLNRST